MVEEDTRERGIPDEQLIPGIKKVSRARLPELLDQHDQIWHWLTTSFKWCIRHAGKEMSHDDPLFIDDRNWGNPRQRRCDAPAQQTAYRTHGSPLLDARPGESFARLAHELYSPSPIDSPDF